jgi:hypothetical protein
MVAIEIMTKMAVLVKLSLILLAPLTSATGLGRDILPMLVA